MQWIKRCTLSPLALILGTLWQGPSSIENLRSKAQTLYRGNPKCWSPKSVDEIIALLTEYGIVSGTKDNLVLEKQRLHPVTRKLAMEASKLI